MSLCHFCVYSLLYCPQVSEIDNTDLTSGPQTPQQAESSLKMNMTIINCTEHQLFA